MTRLPSWRPGIFDPADADGRRRVDELLSNGHVFEVSDTLEKHTTLSPGGGGDAGGVDTILDDAEELILGGPGLGPPHDAVIDQCDPLNVKFLLREWVRPRRLPLLQNTSDRGMLDVERYDLEPEPPVFHGITSGDVADVGEGMSPNLAVALVEPESTISNWPQLASDVVAREPSPKPRAARPEQLPRAGLATAGSTARVLGRPSVRAGAIPGRPRGSRAVPREQAAAALLLGRRLHLGGP